jgi:hypothetical protein
MIRSRRRVATAAILLWAVALLSGCSSQGSSPLPDIRTQPATQAAPGEEHTQLTYASPCDDGSTTCTYCDNGRAINAPPVPLADDNCTACADSTDNGGGPVATIPRNQPCNGARAVNTTANGQSGHNNAISNTFEVFVTAGGNAYLVGYEYQTYGGAEYFQGNFTWGGSVSGGIPVLQIGGSFATSSPIVPWSTSTYQTFKNFINAVGLAGYSLPRPYSLVTAGANLNTVDCYAGGTAA